MAFIYDLTDTWNAGGTAFNGIKMNVTDTASAAASRLMTLQVGGAERFSVRKDGQGYFAGNVGIGTTAPDGLLTLASAIPLLYWNETDQAVDEKKWRFGAQGKVLSLQTTNDAVSVAANAYQIVRGTGTAVDTQIFSTGGSERLRIDASGNLLVATTSASTGNAGNGFVVSSSGDLISRRISGAGRTHVTFVNGGVTVGTIQTSTTATTYNTSSTSGITGVDANTVAIRTNSAERMRIDASGHVGIGSVPGVRFQITHDQAAYSYFDYYNTTNAGGIVWRQIVRNLANSGNTSVDFAKLISSGFAINNNDTGAANFTAFGVGASERMRITSAGAVGIGTTTPAAPLHVAGAGRFGSTTSQTTGALAVYNDGDNVTLEAFAGNSEATKRNILLATYGGNVGIGTSAPADRLSVAGTILATGAVTRSGSGTTSFVAFRNNSDVNSFYEARTTAGSVFFGANAANSFAVGPAASGTGNYLRASNDLFFVSTGGSERMRIDSSGNVGIAQATGINARLSLGALVSNKVFSLYDDGSNQYGMGIAGSQYRMFASTGAVISFGNYARSTDTFTETVRIDTSGNLLVGTTVSPSGVGASGVMFENVSGTGGRITNGKTVSGSVDALGNYHNGTYVGGVVYSNTATSFPTSSDARLKHDIVDAPEASGLIDAIKVRSFKWNADDSEQRYGFVAQELVEVAPEAVSVTADEDEMMAVDYSKLVPMLVKELQSVRARLAQLEGN